MALNTRLETAEQAETAFYTAFENADTDAMMEIWADDGNIMCIHPNGPRLVGQQEFAIDTPVTLDFDDDDALLFDASGRRLGLKP